MSLNYCIYFVACAYSWFYYKISHCCPSIFCYMLGKKMNQVYFWLTFLLKSSLMRSSCYLCVYMYCDMSAQLRGNGSQHKLVLQVTMKSSCYFLFNHSVLLCPNLYSINPHNSLRTCSILVPVPSTAQPSWILFCDVCVPDSRLLSYDWLQTTFTDPYKPLAWTPYKTPIIVDVYTVLLLSTRHVVYHIENKSRDSYFTCPLAHWLSPSIEL
jgi:hypothetical protein